MGFEFESGIYRGRMIESDLYVVMFTYFFYPDFCHTLLDVEHTLLNHFSYAWPYD